MFMEVQKRGPKAFAALIDSLKESGNSVAASILDPSVQIVNTPSPLPEDTQKYCFFYKNISKCFNSFLIAKFGICQLTVFHHQKPQNIQVTMLSLL